MTLVLRSLPSDQLDQFTTTVGLAFFQGQFIGRGEAALDVTRDPMPEDWRVVVAQDERERARQSTGHAHLEIRRNRAELSANCRNMAQRRADDAPGHEHERGAVLARHLDRRLEADAFAVVAGGAVEARAFDASLSGVVMAKTSRKPRSDRPYFMTASEDSTPYP